MTSAAGMRAVFLVAVSLRLLLLAAALALSGPTVLLTSDSREYLDLAESLAAEGRFFRGGQPEVVRLPGYPMFLAPGVLAGHPIAVGLLLQALLAGLTAVLAHAAARLVAGERAAFFAGLLCACEPVMLAWDCFLMAEALLTACVTLSVFCALSYMRDGAERTLIAACLCACAAAYVKPVAYAFPVWMGLLLMTRALVSADGSRRVRHAAVFLLLSLAVLSAWPIRNGLVAGYWWFSRQSEHVAAAAASELVVPRDSSSFEARRQERRRFLSTGKAEALDDAARRRVTETLLASPAAFLRDHVHGMMRTLFRPGGMAYVELFGVLRRDRELRATNLQRGAAAAAATIVQRAPAAALLWLVLGVANAALVALAALSFVKGPGPARLVLLAACAGYFVLAGGGPWSQSRFRHSAMPIVCILAGSALSRRLPTRSPAPVARSR